ncbi:heat shock factor protein [Enterospora canceri]|uniref:Heat shock factor protein n=1 Tax=Enterospora canceri TaxID=1081671 RepID=A0A1Y1S9K8_9MICR|nr:heat shock factor protein [Enterospora canceri]
MGKRQSENEESEGGKKKSNFIARLYSETCNASNKAICFDLEGDKLVIPNKIDFIKSTLCRISSTKDYSSFVRQLNNYGFTKIKTEESDNNCDVYYHQNFHRDHPKLISYVNRDKTKRGDLKQNMGTLVNSLQYLAKCNYRQQKEITEQSERIRQLEIKNQTLYEILGTALRNGFNAYKNKNIPEEVVGSEPLTYRQNGLIFKDDKKQLVHTRQNSESNEDEKPKSLFDEFYF